MVAAGPLRAVEAIAAGPAPRWRWPCHDADRALTSSTAW